MARVLGALACLLLASDARAAPGGAELLLRLFLPPGTATASVSLRARDTPWRATADGRELVRLGDVPPGAYELRVEAAGLEPAADELVLIAGERLRLEARLLPGGGARSSLRVTERFHLSLGAVFDEERLRDLPSSRTIWSVLETTEATAVLDRIEGAGLYAGEPGLVGIHGSSWTQTAYRLGGLDMTEPDAGGRPLLQPALLGLGALQVVSGLAPIEIGAAGPTLVMVPRPASASWQGAAVAAFAPSRGGSVSTPPAIARSDGLVDMEARLEGPLARDRLALGLAGGLSRSRRLERDDLEPLESRIVSLLARLDWIASARNEVGLIGAVEQTRAPDVRRARLARPDLVTTGDSAGVHATWTRRAETFIELTAGFTRASSDPGEAGAAGGRVVERFRDGPVELLFPARTTRTVGQIELHGAPRPFRFLDAVHEPRLGGKVARRAEDARPPEARGLTAETVDGLAADVWDYGWGGPEARWRATEAAAWAADRVSAGRLTVEAGLRLDRTHASRLGDAATIDWTRLSPRLVARVAVTGDDRLSIFGGWGRYAHRLPLGWMAFGDAAAAQGDVYRWDDRDGDGRFEPGERGPLVARVGPGSSVDSLDPRLAAPWTEELTAGFEGRIAGQWRARVLAIRRRERRLVASVNVAVGPTDYDVVRVFDPGGDLLGPADDQLLAVYDRRPESFGRDRYLLTNPAGENSLHEGVELELSGRIGARAWLRLGATASRTNGPDANRGFRVIENDQGLVGERLESPNAETNSRGRLFFDRAYTLKIAGGWRAPGDVRLALAARYQDGQPFARLVVAPGLRQGTDYVQAIPNGRSRFTFTLTVDGRLEKGFAIGRHRIAGSVDAFNLLDNAREVEEDVTTGPSFRAITAVQPPRSVRVGLRLDF